MKIAIATEDQDPAAEISSQGARALFFMLFDANGQLLEVLANPYAANARHVGPDVANLLHDQQVTTVVAGRFGEKFKRVLEGYDIECVVQTGHAVQAMKALLA